MARRAHAQHQRLILTLHADCLVAHIHRDPLAVDLVLVGVGRVQALDVEILHVGSDVGHPPGDAVVVPDHDPRRARKREAAQLVRARVALLDAVQADLVPDRRHLNAEVRVVGEERAAGFRQFPADHPVIRADALTASKGQPSERRSGGQGGKVQRREGRRSRERAAGHVI